MNGEIIAVGGARGVGKSTTLSFLSQNTGEKVIFVSQELTKFCLHETGRGLFSYSSEEKDILRESFGEYLINKFLEQRTGRFILDLHYTDYREGHDKVIQPECILERISKYVILDASSNSILRRRHFDSNRVRDLDLKLIEVERISERKAAERLAAYYKKPFYLFSTEGLSLEIAALDLADKIELYSNINTAV